MKDIGLDFGLLIAYFVPGAIAVAALMKVAPEILPVLGISAGSESIVWISTAIIAGMVVSLFRGTIIDGTFALNLHRIGVFRSKPQYGKCVRVEVDYTLLVSEGVLNAFKEAVIQEKRPYQFYGNTLIATALWALSLDELRIGHWLLFSLVWMLLYVGARRSHFVYMSALRTLNCAR